jgi:hypothetical protein
MSSHEIAALEALADLVQKEVVVGDEERLLKTLRVVWLALLTVYHEAERREFHQWVVKGQMEKMKAGLVWDISEFIRQHNEYPGARAIGLAASLGLREVVSELKSQEEFAARAAKKRSVVRL